MIERVRFFNYRVLKDTELPLQPFTVIVGPNGSGKSTALQALSRLWNLPAYPDLVSAGLKPDQPSLVIVEVHWRGNPPISTKCTWKPNRGIERNHQSQFPRPDNRDTERRLDSVLQSARTFSFNADEIAKPTPLQPQETLGPDGARLAVVLDRLRDEHPERFEALNQELGRWLPEFDRVLFETPKPGHRALMLRSRVGQHAFKASELSHGTLIALAILTLAYLPDPPKIVGIEEPDRGIHPRLLRDVRDALYRLSYPKDYGESREPVQVIATTHSPYFLDLFREHPEEIVIAEKVGEEAKFQRLSDMSDVDEILADARLGDVWYSGILGGVPAQP